MDVLDRADILNQQEYERQLAKVQRELSRKGEEFCIDCDEEIPAGRREKMPSAIRCVTCQNVYEKQLKRG